MLVSLLEKETQAIKSSVAEAVVVVQSRMRRRGVLGAEMKNANCSRRIQVPREPALGRIQLRA